ncbi:MAG: aspartate kinase [Verrucomicrobia bacterium]|nr:aspartate kinase [Verrucomicrobiota bacterium]
MKFGGAAVSSTEQFSRIAEIILNRAGNAKVVVVVSAMGDTTDQLLALAKKVHPEPPLREQDMLVSVGERISVALLAMALQLKNKEAISFTGSQSGIITSSLHSEARIVDVKPHRLKRHLDEGRIVIVAGFQGVSREGEITTLGRGGSDTTAVALGVALEASVIEFYKDVPGICEEDPKKNPYAKVLSNLSYGSALEIIEKGAEVLHARCIKLAERNLLNLHIRSFFDPELRYSQGTLIGPLEIAVSQSCEAGSKLGCSEKSMSSSKFAGQPSFATSSCIYEE